MSIIFWYVWCASIAGDTREYVTAAPTKDAALETVPYFLRQDWDIRPATENEVTMLPHK